MALEDAKAEVDTAITRKGRRGMAYENAFGGVTSFMRRMLTKDLTGVDLAVTGVPFDQAVTNRPGTRLGPRAIREASTLQAFDAPFGWGFNPFESFDIVDYGDLAFDYASVAEFPAVLQAHIAGILEAGAGCIALGGDHSISLPILRAHAARHGPLALVQFDAHTDTWADDDPTRIDHGTMFRKAVNEGLIDAARSVQVGIRTDNPDTMGIMILDAPFVHDHGAKAAVARIREIVGDAKVYLSFDIDALDPAFAPGTGTPVWGGLTSAQAAAMLRGLAGIDLVGGDVVEVSPPFDPAGITAIAGAHVAVELICLWGWARREERGEDR
ncbi:Agmatinase [Rhodovulum sp. P5]|uniref:agmatinase n=1 Tax=Rhodovulum sp. P5 TaxID=1564506 RepID=UPI0009C3D191|nr:agmatinase [Rhodovulum sp. P5]ARE39662.1 Agmatinase [Rhodovulum sp. P5]